jgi:hypothetical protein
MHGVVSIGGPEAARNSISIAMLDSGLPSAAPENGLARKIDARPEPNVGEWHAVLLVWPSCAPATPYAPPQSASLSKSG